jgi:xanthine/uracil/vitamin C permease (AzgA family)
LISYPVLKIASGRGHQVHWLMYVMAGLLVLYYLVIRSQVV